MAIRTIVVNIDIDGEASLLLPCAANLAQRFGATLIGHAAAEPSSTYVGIDGGAVAAEWYGEERQQIESRLDQLAQAFPAAVPVGIASEFRGYVDTPTRSLRATARGADLIVMGGAASTSGPGFAREANVGDLILTSGRPMLIPGAGVSEIMAERIVVGWKDTREARRAAADALPFLVAAKDVLLVTVGEGNRAGEQVALDDGVAWLKRHGVAARGEIRLDEGGASAALQAAATEIGADLLVTGGYGHSRMRELLFGGVTRDLLGRGALSRFVSN